MENLTEVDEYTANVSVPQDTVDQMNAASLKASVQPLANRTLHLHNLLEVASARTIVLPLIGAGAGPGAADVVAPQEGSGTVRVQFQDQSKWIHSIRLPDGVTLSALTLVVDQGNSGAGGQMNAKVYRQAPLAAAVQLGATFTFPDSTSLQSAVISIPSEVIDNSLYSYHIVVQSSALAATNTDSYYGATATVSDPRAGIER